VNFTTFTVPGPNRWGATIGQDDLQTILPQITADSTIVLFDFAAVEVVNSSYLRATVMWLLHAGMLFVDMEEGRARAAPADLQPLNVIPMVMNIRGEVMDDVTTKLDSESLPLLHVDGPDRRTARCLGRLDPALRDTLSALTKMKSATATLLWEQFPQRPPIKPPAWSNRLSDLHRLRLCTREREGRQWRYHSVIGEEVRFG
jgi:hypothetical protein